MFSKIANFFIQNTKLTFVLILVILISGVGSYLIIPKQYNPTIVVPAFMVSIETPSLNSDENKTFITNELENKIMEIEGIDEVFSVSRENMVGVMVKFLVGQNSESAKIRLNQKLNENLSLKPIGIGNPVIKTIDPEELPQITYAISMKTENSKLGSKDCSISPGERDSNSSIPPGEMGLGSFCSKSGEHNLKAENYQNSYIYLRQIANSIKNELKTIPNVTTLDIVGGINKNIFIALDLEKLESTKIDIMQVYKVLNENNISLNLGNIANSKNEKTSIEVDSSFNTPEKLGKILISKNGDSNILLEDISTIKYGVKKLKSYSFYSTKQNLGKEVVFLGIGKKIGTNAVVTTTKIEEKIEELKNKLPKNIEISVIQNEGEKAKIATQELVFDLISSIAIVIVILVIFLGFKNALNTATSIPLILSLVFLLALINGDNINRITLFALILVIGMLVDDSIVVVENIHRHLEELPYTNKTKLEAILSAVDEVGTGVILSTVTKVLSFASMFFVTGMMGEYMGPIPKFAITALLLSIFISFSINPFVSYLTSKNHIEGEKKIKKENKYDIRKVYLRLMDKFINSKESSKNNRKKFKLVFWISLGLIIILPIYFGIFKARMLPKANEDQVYLWIDETRGTTTEKMLLIENEIENFFLNPCHSELDSESIIQNNDKKQKIKDPEINSGGHCLIPPELQITKSISTTIGQALPSDFANLFRGGSNRQEEHMISSRINLISKHELKERVKSEVFVIKIRPLLMAHLKEKFPSIKARLLEDPPGPPVRATFLQKISGENLTQKQLDTFTKKVYSEIEKIAPKYNIADLGNSLPTSYKKIKLQIDNYSLINAGLSTQQVINTLGIITNSIEVSLLKGNNSLEQTNIILGVGKDQSDSLSLLNTISFTNSNGQKIPLSSIASIEYSFVTPEINTDNRKETNYIYAEMGDNSVVYPIVKLYSTLEDSDFLGNDYKLVSSSFYDLTYVGLKDGKTYKIEWDGEWKLTMDTFRDLGTAMILAILAIYFVIVGQFKNFSVAGIIMLPFLLGFFGIFPGFSILYLLKNEYFNATGMIGIISLAGIVVGNAILLVDYIEILKKRGWTIERAIIEAGYIRFMPIMLTSISAIFGAIKITSDPVWSGLAWSIVCGLAASAILTLITIPIFYYDSQKERWECDIDKNHCMM